MVILIFAQNRTSTTLYKKIQYFFFVSFWNRNANTHYINFFIFSQKNRSCSTLYQKVYFFFIYILKTETSKKFLILTLKQKSLKYFYIYRRWKSLKNSFIYLSWKISWVRLLAKKTSVSVFLWSVFIFPYFIVFFFAQLTFWESIEFMLQKNNKSIVFFNKRDIVSFIENRCSQGQWFKARTSKRQ